MLLFVIQAQDDDRRRRAKRGRIGSREKVEHVIDFVDRGEHDHRSASGFRHQFDPRARPVRGDDATHKLHESIRDQIPDEQIIKSFF